jgi:hypothetical protein
MTSTVFTSLLRFLVLFGLFLTSAYAVTYDSSHGNFPSIASACASYNRTVIGFYPYTVTSNNITTGTVLSGRCFGTVSGSQPPDPSSGSSVDIGYYLSVCPTTRTGIYVPYSSPAPANRCVNNCQQSVSTPATGSGYSNAFLEWQFSGDYCAVNTTPPVCVLPKVIDPSGTVCITPPVTCVLPAKLDATTNTCKTAVCTFPLSLSQTTGSCVAVSDTTCTAPAVLVNGFCTVTLGGLTCPVATLVNGACPSGGYTTGTPTTGTGTPTTGTGTVTIDYAQMPGASVAKPSNIKLNGGFGVSVNNCNAGSPETSCDADAILCAIAKFTYESRCNSASIRADDSMTTVSDGLAAHGLGTNALGTDSRIPVTNANLIALDNTNPFSSQCPADLHVTEYKGTSIDIPLSRHCNIFQIMGNIMLVIAGLISVSIIMKGV